MIRYNPKTWFALIFHSYSKFVFRNLVPTLLFLAVYTAGLVFVLMDVLELPMRTTTAVHSILGIVLGLFLVFRTNTAYDRWWEGRVQWGNLVNDSRNLAQKLNAMLDPSDHKNRKFFINMIPGFIVTLEEHLRKEPEYDVAFVNDDEDDERPGTEEFEDSRHKPNLMLQKIHTRLIRMKNSQEIDNFEYLELQKNVDALTDVLGACERIRNTPIPYSYSMFMKKFIFLFMITLPFGFMGLFYYWTIAIVLLLTYILLGTELIAEEIEDPFGRDINDLPTDYLSEVITTNVNDIIRIKE